MKPSTRHTLILGAITALAFTAPQAAELIPDPPHVCEPCETWAAPGEPFKVFGNTWFVGGGLSSVLIASKGGHILIDGGLPQSAADIDANIRQLGFRLEDVKLIVNSHTHYDHAGGIAALQRASEAQVAASPAAKRALERGNPTEDDPQFAFGTEHNQFPPVRNVRTVRDGETLQVGDLSITVHFTPGHTPGGTSWTWKSCEGARCLDIVYADSLNSVSAPGFRFSGDAAHASRVALFRKSIQVVADLPCDILLTPHPEAFDRDQRLAALQRHPDVNPFVDKGACRAYAAGALGRLEKRLAEESSGTTASQTPH